MLRFALVLTALLVTPPALSARTWHITPDGTGDAPTIQAAVDSASAGDTVSLAAGIYREHDIDLVSGVSLKSAAGDPAVTIIDAERKGRVIRAVGLDATTLIEGITITQGFAGWAAGMDCEQGSPVVRRCVFSYNVSESLGGDGYGGALLCYDQASPTIEDCVFLENTADWGGGAYCDEGSHPTFLRCVFVGNSAGAGGGLFCNHFTAPTISECTFVGNFIIDPGFGFSMLGAGIGLGVASPLIENTIIAFSPSGTAIGTLCPYWPPSPTIECSNFYGNVDGDWVGCSVEDQAGAAGNFSADPLFCDLDGGVYMIRSNSPCAPPGATGCGLIGALPVGCGPVSLEPDTWARVKARYR